jgi:hypothetical protein
MQLVDFSRESAKRYLQNIVFIDDEIYTKVTGQPVISTLELPAFISPFGGGQTAVPAEAKGVTAATKQTPIVAEAVSAYAVSGGKQQEPPADAKSINIAEDKPEEKIPYHPRQLVESFAKEGMICALYEPKENFAADENSELYKLCERADVVVLDWDLYGMDGKNVLPLISNLVDESQNTVPHHSRLCVIYTTKPDLARVGSAIYDHLNKAELKVQDVIKPATLVAGATRIVVLGKPNVPGRSEEIKALEVPEEDLATRIIQEFAIMHEGILPSYALRGMAAVRRNSKKILDKFQKDLDSVFLVHRALVLKHEDAFDQLPELLAEEVLAVIHDDQIAQTDAAALANNFASTLPLERVTMAMIDGRPQQAAGVLARRFVGGGEPAVAEDHKLKHPPTKLVKQLHDELGCPTSHVDKQLAALFNLRTRYFNSKSPSLGFGTVVRFEVDKAGGAAGEKEHKYALCLMPLCDSMRLSRTDPTSFPFWTLHLGVSDGKSGRGIVVHTKDSGYVELLATGKPRDKLWIEAFQADASGTVIGEHSADAYFFNGGKKLEWVAQLKPAHAQRVAHDIGQEFSRVGVVEAEWLRLATTKN